ncbi:MAG: DUF1700 domain-containing protein [Cellulosilyticaceae bacterium]
MNRREYMKELAQKLSRMPEQERMEAMGYYEEYFDEAGPENEAEVIKNLGTPTQVARQILADFAVKESVARPESPKKGIGAVVFIILAIFAAPIALPLAIAAVAVVFALLVVLVVLAFTGVIVVASFVFAGVVSFFASFAVIATNPATGIFALGVGISFIGLGILVAIGIYVAWVKCMPSVVRGINDGLNRLQRRGRA